MHFQLKHPILQTENVLTDYFKYLRLFALFSQDDKYDDTDSDSTRADSADDDYCVA